MLAILVIFLWECRLLQQIFLWALKLLNLISHVLRPNRSVTSSTTRLWNEVDCEAPNTLMDLFATIPKGINPTFGN